MSLRLALVPLLLAAALPSISGAAPRPLQPRDLASLDRFSSPVLTPDGKSLVYARRVVDFDANKSSTALWVQDAANASAKPRRLTPDGWNVNSPEVAPDGKSVYFLSSKTGVSQLYSVALAGGAPQQVTALALDVGSFDVAPNGQRVALGLETYPECAGDLACTQKRSEGAGKSKATGVVFDRLFIRHWDAFNEGKLNRLFVADLPPAGAMVSQARLIGGNVIADVPSRPFGDNSEFGWSPDSKSVVFGGRNADREEPWSTNFDLYIAPADVSADARNLTAANKAWDAGGVFSHDGRTLYYRAMKRPGFEADRFALMSMDIATGATREIAPNWDRSAEGITLSADGRTIYTLAEEMGEKPLFAVDVASGVARRVVGGGTVSAFDIQRGTLAFARNSFKSGDQLFASSLDGKSPRALSPSAGDMLKDVRFGDSEGFTFKGWNDETVHGYVTRPWNYQKGHKYPVAFLIHGGPQGSFSNGWSYRWNPQTYAAQGYAVVTVDFHGSTGYGQAFTDSISQHWGDRPLEDLQKGWASALKQYPFLNGDKACALGASYGGYMVYWIAGNWPQPWKCLVDHDGVFDARMMGYSTEELWFSEWENGGTPWENPKAYEKFNPINHVSEWRVPMLVIHGQKDFRIPVEQGIAAFSALQRKGIESKFLYFPDENHWVLKPQNSVLWQDTVTGWLKHYIGE